MTKHTTQRGTSMIELLFYISLLAVLSLVVINSMITMTKSFKETSIQTDLMQGGDVMERISREVKRATGIASITSNDLKINTKDDAGNAKTMEFLLSGNDIQLLENDVLTGNLNTANIIVNSLSFEQLTTVKGSAVKIILSVESKNNLSRSESFYDTVILRGDY